jgi:cyclopropane-fatty-acyl-phospholipid synthase
MIEAARIRAFPTIDTRKTMRLLAIEHSLSGYRADFIFYGLAWLTLMSYLALGVPVVERGAVVGLASAGLAAWTLVEYLFHRFVLHGIPPFSKWHAMHHRHPRALIFTPTVLSAALLMLLVFLPALAFGNPWRAWGLTFGMLSGYLVYTLAHHAFHQSGAVLRGLLGRRRRRWHALHHAAGGGYYGVTTAFWDHVFMTDHFVRR